MAILTKKQRNFIRKNCEGLAPEIIAGKVGVPVKDINDYLAAHNLKATIPVETSTISTNNGSFFKFLIRNRVLVFVIFVAALAVYANTLGNGFVSDDRDLPLDFKYQTYFQKIFSSDVSFRVPEVFHYFDSLGGLFPWRYHLTNTLLHAVVSLLVFYFLSPFVKIPVAFFAALLFAVHPLHTDAVSWVVARSYILYTLFLLSSFLLYIKATADQFIKRKFFLVSLIFYLLAIESRWLEPITFPIILFLYNLSFRSLKEKWKTILPYIVLIGFYVFRLFSTFQTRINETSTGAGGQLELNNPLIHVPIAIFTYLRLFLLPIDLTFYHEDLTAGQVSYIISIIGVLAYVIFTFYLYKKNRTLFFFSSLFLISLLHTFSPLKIAWAIAERYAYFGSIGLSVLFIYPFFNLAKHPRIRNLSVALLIIILSLYSLRTIIRNFDWRSEDTLWLATVKTSPTSSKAWNNVGDYYSRHNDTKNALKSFQTAFTLRPDYADAIHNYGNTLMQMGKLDEALPYFEKVITLNPNIIETYNNLAIIYYQKGESDRFREMIEKALKVNPQSTKTYNLLSYIYYNEKNYEMAKQTLKKIIEIDPLDETAKQNLALIEAEEKKGNQP